MSEFVPTKQHLREVLLFCFNSKKKAAEAHRLLIEAYGEHALSDSTCKEWYKRFKAGDFDVNDKERPGQPRKFSDEEFEELINDNPSLTQKELAEALNVDQTTIRKRAKSIGIRQKDGKWVGRNNKHNE